MTRGLVDQSDLLIVQSRSTHRLVGFTESFSRDRLINRSDLLIVHSNRLIDQSDLLIVQSRSTHRSSIAHRSVAIDSRSGGSTHRSVAIDSSAVGSTYRSVSRVIERPVLRIGPEGLRSATRMISRRS